MWGYMFVSCPLWGLVRTCFVRPLNDLHSRQTVNSHACFGVVAGGPCTTGLGSDRSTRLRRPLGGRRQRRIVHIMKWIHVWSSRRLPVIVLDSSFVFHAWLAAHIRSRVWRHARSPYQWQRSSVINKLRIFVALICLEAFFHLASAETCLAVTAPPLPRLIGLEGSRD